MQMKYVDHLPTGLAFRAMELYLHALRDKFHPILGCNERIIELLRQIVDPNHCLTALRNQEPVGILGIQTSEGGFLNPTLKSLISEYGVISGFYKLTGLYLLDHVTAIDEWYVDGIAVAEERRGLGIGSELMLYFEKTAKEKGIRKLSLDVTNTNPRARALYERLGFVVSKQIRIWPFNRIYGLPFESAILMEKELSASST